MTCPRCWRIIGESYKCREHGGGDAFNANTPKSKPVDLPPVEALWDYSHPYFDFLDNGVMRRRLTDTITGEFIP